MRHFPLFSSFFIAATLGVPAFAIAAPPTPGAPAAAPAPVPPVTAAATPASPPTTSTTPAPVLDAAPSPAPVAAPPAPTVEAPSAPAASPPTADARIQQLEQKVSALEHHVATENSQNAVLIPGDATPGVAVAYANDGVSIRSNDGRFVFRLRPILQTDGRFFVDGGTNQFLLRRVRPYLEGTAFSFFDWRIMPDFAGTPTVYDAYGNIRLVKEVQLQFGKYKAPVGLERLASDTDLPFVERGLPSDLVPDRDVGVMLHGDLVDGALTYALGIFNGTDDGVQNDTDNNDKKDVDGRIFALPFKPTTLGFLKNFGLGVSASSGKHAGAQPTYKTMGQNSFFSYSSAAVSEGIHRRIVPQAYYYVGPVGILAEYAISSQGMTAGATTARVTDRAFQVLGSVFLTGDTNSYGTVTPKHQLDPAHGGFGAVQLVARYGELHIDKDAFTTKLADPAKSAIQAREWALGANWHLARNVKLMADYEHTNFIAGAKNEGNRTHEAVFMTRFQVAY
ncbi:MAG TPA: porin [Polyangiaceae bacterium]|jgi:phosphate-selective porin OprO/OprP|nr:porin [Polyangiaceae bacterium]